MKKKFFSKGQMIELEKNPNVLRVNEQAITYHPDFKVKAVLKNIKGESPARIFMDHGFDLDIIGKELPRKRLYQWRKIYNESGEMGLTLIIEGKRGSSDLPQRNYQWKKNLKRLRQE